MAVTSKGLMLALITAALVLLAATAGAGDLHRFDDPALQARYDALTASLRCPKCENQAIGDSGSPIAGDMRSFVARALRQGDSDEAIREAMVARFGDYVLYRPRLEWRTIALWAGPGVVVLLGIAGIGALIKSRRGERPEALNIEERQRLETLLSRHQDSEDQDRSHQ